MNTTFFEDSILKWYAKNQRNLPWRTNCVYKVCVSEFMLQQTTVKTVIPYFHRFIQKFPSFYELSLAPETDVLKQWAGLGYYTRARNLHKLSKKIVEYEYFPDSIKELEKLPGIGPYTSKAIASIFFNQKVLPIDGNIKRIFSRFFNLEPKNKNLNHKIDLLSKNFSFQNPNALAQGLMDFGSLVCTPKNPSCQSCVLSSKCLFDKTSIPIKTNKLKIEKFAYAFCVINQNKEIFVKQNTTRKLLKNLYEFPLSEFMSQAFTFAPPNQKKWELIPTSIKHTFTHFKLYLQIAITFDESFNDQKGIFINFNNEVPISTLMKKAIELVQKHIKTN